MFIQFYITIIIADFTYFVHIIRRTSN